METSIRRSRSEVVESGSYNINNIKSGGKKDEIETKKPVVSFTYY